MHSLSISEGSRTDDRPVLDPSPNVGLLAYMVGDHWTQEEPKHDVFPEDVPIAPTISDYKSRLADETSDAHLFPRANDISCSL